MDVVNGKAYVETYKKVRSILVSQPKPERSPYYELEKKYELQIDWRPFIQVEALSAKEFRKQRIRPDEFSSIIFTSKNSIDHFFSICEEMRVKMSQETKYFCLTDAVANYLQKFIIYRKRKVFSGTRAIQDLKPYLMKHKEKEKFLLPCSNLGAKQITSVLDEYGVTYQEAMMYNVVSSDLSDLKNIYYDVIVFFTPLEIEGLYENFPDFSQKATRIAVFGSSALKAVQDKGLYPNIKAPEPETPSMTMALEKYLQVSNKE
ncbi:MAG: uroporphyrinogen-III synthase [Bacteroidetes bacterium]|nr:uroporphyrinogen-III synthase [Bacteroidota bacterium]